MKNEERIRYFYEVVVSENRLDELAGYVSGDCVVKEGTQSVPLGVEGMRQHLLAVRKTYPDYTLKIIRQYCDGDYVISEFVMTGTHKGEFMGITPTDQVLSIFGVDIDKMAEGKIVEHGGAANTFEAFMEHGLIRPV